jgi:hypothetical protein
MQDMADAMLGIRLIREYSTRCPHPRALLEHRRKGQKVCHEFLRDSSVD